MPFSTVLQTLPISRRWFHWLERISCQGSRVKCIAAEMQRLCEQRPSWDRPQRFQDSGPPPEEFKPRASFGGDPAGVGAELSLGKSRRPPQQDSFVMSADAI